MVGASGVGKTQILKAIETISKIAKGVSFNGIEWLIEFEEAGKGYIWSGQFECNQDHQGNPLFDKTEFPIIEENLSYINGDNIFRRNKEELIYNDRPTVKLDSSKSAVELLKEEDAIAPIKQALDKIIWLYNEEGSQIRLLPGLLSKIDSPMTLKDIKNVNFRTPIEKLFLIQRNHPEVFAQIKDRFIEIFPLVEDIDFDLEQILKNDVFPILKIKERNVDNWIKLPDISSGMCRTISQIVALTLADDGDVILIDEFENGLGINCINQLADMAMETDVQIIMTSHHPYIINSIPFKDWRIVSRNGSNVTVKTAADLRIGEFSKHDAFMQLIQTSEYMTGQS